MREKTRSHFIGWVLVHFYVFVRVIYQIYRYHEFKADVDSAKLYNDLRWNLTRPQGLEGVMRVRCSNVSEVDFSAHTCCLIECFLLMARFVWFSSIFYTFLSYTVMRGIILQESDQELWGFRVCKFKIIMATFASVILQTWIFLRWATCI